MNDNVEDVKNRLDIVEIVSSYLTLKKAGANWKARCPFHNEKTPSMMISPERQTFKCYGCGEGGDIFTFIEKMEGVDFYNALKILADRAGVELESHTISYSGHEHKADKKTRLLEMNDWARKLYYNILTEHPTAQKAREYLDKRGLSKKTIEEFQIGYAPDSWDFLIKFLKRKEYKEEEMAEAGLVIQKSMTNYYDRFRGRIIFPINNVMGSTIAFTSRILKDDPNAPKYINSSESAIYTKGKTVYGLDKAKLSIKEKDEAILVEGNMDVISCRQAGFKNVVATSGTALTEDQLKTLARYASSIVFSFDNDNAGFLAFQRAVEIAVKNDINTKMISMPFPYKDPDEAIKANPKHWEDAIAAAKPSIEYWIDKEIKKYPGLEVIEKKQIAKKILPVIKLVYSPIEKECYLKYLAGKLSISEKSLISALEKTKESKESPKSNPPDIEKPKIDLKDKIIGIIWLVPDAIKNIETDEIRSILKEKGFERTAEMVSQGRLERGNLVEAEKLSLDQLAIMAFEEYGTQDIDVLFIEIKFLLGRLKSDQRESIRIEFAQKIKNAEEKKDKKELAKLLAEFASLIK